MFMSDEVLAGLLEAIDERMEEPGEGTPPREALESLRSDIPSLGLFGVLTVLPDSPPPDEQVAREQVDQLRLRMLKGLEDPLVAGAAAGATGGDGGEGKEAEAEAGPPQPDLSGAPPLADLLERYAAEKGEKLVRRAFENALFDFYDLQDHGLFVDDVGKALDLIRATTGEHDDIKEYFRRALRLSAETAKFILGLFPEQIALIHRLSSRQVEPHELDKAFESFGPRAIRLRLYGVTATLIERQVRMRLAIQLWARGRGVAITREQILEIPRHLELKSADKLIARLVERREARRELVEFLGSHPDIGLLERHL